MTNIKSKIFSALLLSLVATVAGANILSDLKSPELKCKDDRRCVAAPEIDPAQGMSALMLLAGTVAILRGRRGKK